MRSSLRLTWSCNGISKKNRGIYFAKQGFATVDINWLGRPVENGLENTDREAWCDTVHLPKGWRDPKLFSKESRCEFGTDKLRSS